MNKKRLTLHSYRQYYDGNFNPNTVGGICTMAQCCPEIRERAELGDWIIGFAANNLLDAGESVKMIHAMQVTRKMTLEEYYHWVCSTPLISMKKPDDSNVDTWCGDCIYEFRNNQIFLNRERELEAVKSDLKSKYVLISENFHYYGKDKIDVPRSLKRMIPERERQYYGRENDPAIPAFLAWEKTLEPNCIHAPHQQMTRPHNPQQDKSQWVTNHDELISKSCCTIS